MGWSWMLFLMWIIGMINFSLSVSCCLIIIIWLSRLFFWFVLVSGINVYLNLNLIGLMFNRLIIFFGFFILLFLSFFLVGVIFLWIVWCLVWDK